jgi:hypothetical protein
MSTLSIHITRPTTRTIRMPELHIEIPRKDLWLCALIVIAGLALQALMVFDVITPSLVSGMAGFGLVFTGGIAFLIRLGEIG